MATMIRPTVTVYNLRQPAKGPQGKPTALSTIQVKIGNHVIASRTLAGTWNAVQAEREFRRFPERFKPVAQGVTVNSLRAMAG
jgi:hypothetical protein